MALLADAACMHGAQCIRVCVQNELLRLTCMAAYLQEYLHQSRLAVQELADACEEGDVEKFTNVLSEYDSMTKLDPWKTSILLRVKKRIPEEDFT